MKSKINAMQTDNTIIYPFMRSVRCGAKTRQGTACQSPAVRERKRCRMHGGTNNGAPIGNCNAFKNGFSTKEVKQIKKTVRMLINEIQS